MKSIPIQFFLLLSPFLILFCDLLLGLFHSHPSPHWSDFWKNGDSLKGMREKLERICRYISSLSEQRLSVNSQRKVIYNLKTPYGNGTTHIILEPLDFLSRLASLIPRPRVNLTRFHGVFAPNFKPRPSKTSLLSEVFSQDVLQITHQAGFIK